MKFYFVSLFPELIEPWLTSSIPGQALRKGVFEFEALSLRNFALDKHRRTDDSAYGGGGGMVLKVEPLVLAIEQIHRKSPNARTLLFAPQGTPLNIGLIERTLASDHSEYILICGHYEGVDHRFIEGWVDQVISVGDFVISGGELPALLFADAVIRHCDGALRQNAAEQESFSLTSNGHRLLEYPQYTRPPEFRGHRVPDVLISGNHTDIAQWRLNRSLEITERERPDLLATNGPTRSLSNLPG